MLFLTPREVYDAYPASDLLPCPRPEPQESLNDWKARCPQPLGDTLFQFLVNEICEEELDGGEAICRLAVAVSDISALLRVVVTRYRRETKA